MRQLVRGLAFALMIGMAQLPPSLYARWSVPLFRRGGAAAHRGGRVRPYRQGAQRWLDLGFMKFQPSEVMKLSMPIMVLPGSVGIPCRRSSAMMIALVMVLLPTC